MKRLMQILAAMALAIVAVLGLSAPAQANVSAPAPVSNASVTVAPAYGTQPPIEYIANCPTNQFGEDAAFQQLVTRNWNGNPVWVTATITSGGVNTYRELGGSPNNYNGGITYWTVQDADTVRYTLDAIDRNYFYHVDCFY